MVYVHVAAVVRVVRVHGSVAAGAVAVRERAAPAEAVEVVVVYVHVDAVVRVVRVHGSVAAGADGVEVWFLLEVGANAADGLMVVVLLREQARAAAGGEIVVVVKLWVPAAGRVKVAVVIEGGRAAARGFVVMYAHVGDAKEERHVIVEGKRGKARARQESGPRVAAANLTAVCQLDARAAAVLMAANELPACFLACAPF